MKKSMIVIVLLMLTTTVEARHRHHYHRTTSYDKGTVVSHPSGCPWHSFCGCGVSVEIFGHPIRGLFLAANWFRFPRANPAPGMVAVRHGHVMAIRAVDANGNATVYDPNSGHHLTRIHQRSLAGYTIVDPNGNRAAPHVAEWQP
jgi:hypothetical protein